jgi:hypothetical protein
MKFPLSWFSQRSISTSTEQRDPVLSITISAQTLKQLALPRTEMYGNCVYVFLSRNVLYYCFICVPRGGKLSKGASDEFLDTVEATTDFLRTVGCTSLASLAFFKDFPPPFAITGLLLGVVRDQLQLSAQAKDAWAGLANELRKFNEEISGGVGYAELFDKMIKNDQNRKIGPDANSLLADLKFETVKLNSTFAFLLRVAKGFFEGGPEVGRVFDAEAHQMVADKAQDALAKYRDALARKTKRYSELMLLRLTNVDFKLINHEAFRAIWALGNWTAEAAVADLVTSVEKNSTCCPEVIQRFKSHLHREHPNGRIGVDSVNKMTADLDPLLNLADTVVALTPVKISYGRTLQHPAFRKLWMWGEENQLISSSSVPVEKLVDVVIAYAGSVNQNVLLAMKELTANLCPASNSAKISVTDVARMSVGLDPELSLLGTIEALLAAQKCDEGEVCLDDPVPELGGLRVASSDNDPVYVPPAPVAHLRNDITVDFPVGLAGTDPANPPVGPSYPTGHFGPANPPVDPANHPVGPFYPPAGPASPAVGPVNPAVHVGPANPPVGPLNPAWHMAPANPPMGSFYPPAGPANPAVGPVNPAGHTGHGNAPVAPGTPPGLAVRLAQVVRSTRTGMKPRSDQLTTALLDRFGHPVCRTFHDELWYLRNEQSANYEQTITSTALAITGIAQRLQFPLD